MRRRDVHALVFAALTISILYAAALLVSRSGVVAGCLTAAYAVLLFTRPRMIRVMRRLVGRGPREWSGYYDD